MNDKIGMVTFFRDNYGAFLQAYALQQVLISYGFKPELINYDFRRENAIVGIPIKSIQNPFVFAKRIVVNIIKYPWHQRRESAFKNDINELLILSKKYDKYKDLLKAKMPYFLCLTGSDQMFNPLIQPQSFYFRMLCFCNCYKASYAASSGKQSLEADYLPFFKNELEKYVGVSVREKSLCNYISKELGVDAIYNIDPSLLLNASQWKKISKPTNYGKYIFVYLAGFQKEVIEKTNVLSSKLGLPVLVADRDYKMNNQIKRKKYLRPTEWLDAIYNAEYVVTNSFHGTAFCINFHKKALIIATGKRNERLLDLIHNCNVDRLLNDTIINDEELLNLYDDADSYLEKERRKSFEYISSFKRFIA